VVDGIKEPQNQYSQDLLSRKKQQEDQQKQSDSLSLQNLDRLAPREGFKRDSLGFLRQDQDKNSKEQFQFSYLPGLSDAKKNISLDARSSRLYIDSEIHSDKTKLFKERQLDPSEKLARDPDFQKLVSERFFQAAADYRSRIEGTSNERSSNSKFSPREIQIQDFLNNSNSGKSGTSPAHQLARELIDADTSKIAPVSSALSILFAGVEKDKQPKLASDLTSALNRPGQLDVDKLFGLMSTAEAHLTDDKKQENLDRIAEELLANNSSPNQAESLKQINDLLGSSQYTEGVKTALVKALTNKISGGDPKKLEELRALLPGLVDTSKGQLRDLTSISNQVTESILGSLAGFGKLSKDQKLVLRNLSPERDLTDVSKMRSEISSKAYNKTHEQLEQEKSNGLLGGWLSPSAWGASYNQEQIESNVLNYPGPHGDKKLAEIDVDKLTGKPAQFSGVPTREQLHQSIREGFAKELQSQVAEQTRTRIEAQEKELIELAKVFERLPGNKPTPKVDIYSLASLQSASQEIKPETPRTQEAPLDPKNKEEIKDSVLDSVVAGLQNIDMSNVDKIAKYLTDPNSQNSSMALESALMKVESLSSNPKELRTLASLIGTIPKEQISSFTPALREFMSKASTSIDPKEKQKAFMSLLNTRVQGLELNEQSRILSTVFTEALSRSPNNGQVKLFSDLLSRVDDSKKDSVLQSIASLPLSDPDQMKSLLEDPSKLNDHLLKEKLEELKSNLVDAGIKLLDEKGIRDDNPIDPVLQEVLRSNLKDFDLSQLPKLLSSDPANKQVQKQFLDDLVTKALQAKKEAVKGLMAADQQIEFSNFLADLKSLESMTKADDVQAEAANKLPDTIPAYLLANAKPEQIQALSQALLEMKDTQTLQKASNEQIAKLFDSVLTGLDEGSQAALISGLLTQSSPQQDLDQAQNVARALVAMRSKPEIFAGALRDLSQLESLDPQKRDLEAFKSINSRLQELRHSDIANQELRDKHKAILVDLLGPQLEQSLNDLSAEIPDKDRKIYQDLTASMLMDLKPENIDTLMTQVAGLSKAKNLAQFLESGKEILNTMIDGYSSIEAGTRLANPNILNPLANDLLTNLLQTTNAKKYGLDKVSDDARADAASLLVDFASCYDCNEFSTKNISQVLNVANALLNGLKPEDQKSFLQQASLDILTKAGMPADKEHYSKLVGDFITGMSNDQRKSIIDVGLAFYAHPELSPNQIFSNSEQLSSKLGLPKDLIESAQKGLAESGLKILQNQAKSKNLPIDFSRIRLLLTPGLKGSLIDSQGKVSSASVTGVAQQLTGTILDTPKTSQEHQYRQEAINQREAQHQATVRARAIERGAPQKAAYNWYPGARGGLFRFGFGSRIAYPQMNAGYYNSRDEANARMREGVNDRITKEVTSQISSDPSKKQSLEMFSGVLEAGYLQPKASTALETRLSDLDSLKSLAGLVQELNPQKEFLASIATRLKNNDSISSSNPKPTPKQASAVKIETAEELKKYYVPKQFSDIERANLLKTFNYYIIQAEDGKSYIAYKSKKDPQNRGMWEFSQGTGAKIKIYSNNRMDITQLFLRLLDKTS